LGLSNLSPRRAPPSGSAMRTPTGYWTPRRAFFYHTVIMAWEIAVSAPAKVNLHLHVLRKMPDGYHGIVSLIQAVALTDEIRMRRAGRTDRLMVLEDGALLPEDNTIVRAVRAFRGETGCREGLEVGVKKAIPMGAGLGGGSSDAAAVLLGLQGLFGRQIPRESLLQLAASIGSDVPFFLGEAAAVVEGRGEKVAGIPAREDYALTALFPAEAVSTPEAYRWLDEDGAVHSTRRLAAAELAERYRQPVSEWDMSNDFDAAVFARRPMIRRARARLAEEGALDPRLTGSGSTVIGVFPDEEGASACVRRIRDFRAAVLRPLAKMPGLR
jgi:4-diphosphocytidyl-2-C-methyl-D-erythritol kinase